MYKLIIQDDEGKTTVVPLIRDEITIGRKEGNTIRLTERNVSRRHARIVKSNGTVLVEDLDSYNGVKVNGARIQGRINVNESDRIQIGDYLLELKVDRGAQVDPYQNTPTAPLGTADMLASSQPIPPGALAVAAALAPQPSQVSGNGTGNQTAVVNLNTGRSTKPTTPMTPMNLPAPGAAASGVPNPIEMQPTTPMAGPPANMEMPARLVVVSSNFGGREFLLDKPAVVIGRTEDNDIVINHRSISRHHAKIVQESGRFAIVDNGSANGVRVNGEEYGKVELRRGDMIDLGHVRLRYVDPGEDFVFDRDATLVDVSTRPRKGKGGIIAIISVVVAAAAAVAIFFVIRGNGTGSTTDPNPPVANGSSSAPVAMGSSSAAVVAASGPDGSVGHVDPPVNNTITSAPMANIPSSNAATSAAPSLTTSSSQPTQVLEKPDVAKLLADGNQAVSDEKWAIALANAEQILKADPQNVDAKKLQAVADAEGKNQATFDKFMKFADTGKVADAVKTLKDLPASSRYHDRAQETIDKMHDSWLKSMENEAKSMRDKGQCDRIATLARHSGDVFPDTKAILEKYAVGCTVATNPDKPPTNPDKPPTNPDKPPTNPTAPTADEITALGGEAKDAAKNGSWAEARKKADEVLKSRPDEVDMLTVAGVSSCHLKDKGSAAKYVSRLKGQRQTMIKQLCAGVGITLD